MASRFVLPVFLLNLAACENPSTQYPAVYGEQFPLCATEMKWDLQNKDTRPDKTCIIGNPGSEMYDRDRGQIGVPEGVSIVATAIFTGLTGTR